MTLFGFIVGLLPINQVVSKLLELDFIETILRERILFKINQEEQFNESQDFLWVYANIKMLRIKRVHHDANKLLEWYFAFNDNVSIYLCRGRILSWSFRGLQGRDRSWAHFWVMGRVGVWIFTFRRYRFMWAWLRFSGWSWGEGWFRERGSMRWINDDYVIWNFLILIIRYIDRLFKTYNC